MSHVRKQIRSYFETQLTGLASTGSNVYESRIYPLVQAKLPALIVYTTTESSQEAAFGAQVVQHRVLTVTVEGYVRALANFDDSLDQIATEVEEAILDDRTLGGLANNTVLTSTDSQYSGEGEQPVGTIVLSFEVTYRTQSGQPETAI